MRKEKKKLSNENIKRLQFIANSAYGPMADFTIDEWFHACEWMRQHPEHRVQLRK